MAGINSSQVTGAQVYVTAGGQLGYWPRRSATSPISRRWDPPAKSWRNCGP